jgi:hypothetical protein
MLRDALASGPLAPSREEAIMHRMPPLDTPRLIIRPFVMDDLPALHQLLDVELADADFGSDAAAGLQERAEWLQWTVLNYEQLARLHQPPYGDRAIVLKATGRLIGAGGFVPSVGPFSQLPARAAAGAAPRASSFHTRVRAVLRGVTSMPAPRIRGRSSAVLDRLRVSAAPRGARRGNDDA